MPPVAGINYSNVQDVVEGIRCTYRVVKGVDVFLDFVLTAR